jgi:hypothetical protein
MIGLRAAKPSSKIFITGGTHLWGAAITVGAAEAACGSSSSLSSCSAAAAAATAAGITAAATTITTAAAGADSIRILKGCGAIRALFFGIFTRHYAIL